METPRSPEAVGDRSTQPHRCQPRPSTAPGRVAQGQTHELTPPLPTYQLRQHLLQLFHVHTGQVLCLGLPDTADGRFCHEEKSKRCRRLGGLHPNAPGPQPQLPPCPCWLAAQESEVVAPETRSFPGTQSLKSDVGKWVRRDEQSGHVGSQLTRDEDLQQLCHEQQRISANCKVERRRSQAAACGQPGQGLHAPHTPTSDLGPPRPQWPTQSW